MIKASRRTLIITLVAILLVWATWGGFQLIYRFSGKSDSKVLTIPENLILTIDANTSDIFITGTSSEKLSITSTKAGDLQIEENGNIVTVKLKDRHFFADGFLTIELPKNTKKLSVKTNVGDLDIASIDIDEMSLITSTGDIDITNFTGDKADLEAQVGDIEISTSALNRELIISTSTGDITLESTSAPNIFLSSSVGDIDILGGSFSQLEAKTSTGDIYLDIEGENGTFDVETGNLGEIEIFKNQLESGEQTIVYGSGEPKVKAKTSIGSIQVN